MEPKNIPSFPPDMQGASFMRGMSPMPRQQPLPSGGVVVGGNGSGRTAAVRRPSPAGEGFAYHQALAGRAQ